MYSLERKSDFVKFHAKQAIATFLPLTVIMAVLQTILPRESMGIVSQILGLIMVVLWIICMVKAYQGDRWKVPILGELVE